MNDLANWNPGPGGADAPAKQAKLMSTEAHDDPETMSATNEQKRWVGKSSSPKGPFGIRGQEF